MSADLLLGAWLGGMACYLGVLRSPPVRMPWPGAVLLALCWPLVISLALGGSEADRE